MLVLSHDDVLAALPGDECADAMAAVLAGQARGETYMPLRSVMAAPAAAGFLGLMPGWHGGETATFALKAVCVMPGNPVRGLDAHQGIVTLFDGETGIPTAILEASAITQIRTAAVTAVATRLLAREDARVLAILGAGVQARAHLDALLAVRPFDTVRIYSPTAAHAHALADRGLADHAPGGRGLADHSLAGQAPAGRGLADHAPAGQARADRGHPTIAVAPSAEDAVRGADVVVTATSSREPVLRREWLGPGVHVNAVGASMPSAREIDVETVAASALFADSRESLRNEAGEYRLAVSEGAITGEDHVRAELGEVLAGLKPGRRSAEELTLFRSLGLAVEDLAAAEHAVAVARRLGLGTEVEL